MKTLQKTGMILALLGAATMANAQRPDRGAGNQGNQKRAEELGAAAILEKYDADGDKELSLSELETFVAEQKSRMQAMRERGARGPREQAEESEPVSDTDKVQGKRGGDRQRLSREEIIKKFDTDGDGTLSDAERAVMRETLKKGRTQE